MSDVVLGETTHAGPGTEIVGDGQNQVSDNFVFQAKANIGANPDPNAGRDGIRSFASGKGIGVRAVGDVGLIAVGETLGIDATGITEIGVRALGNLTGVDATGLTGVDAKGSLSVASVGVRALGNLTGVDATGLTGVDAHGTVGVQASGTTLGVGAGGNVGVDARGTQIGVRAVGKEPVRINAANQAIAGGVGVDATGELTGIKTVGIVGVDASSRPSLDPRLAKTLLQTGVKAAGAVGVTAGGGLPPDTRADLSGIGVRAVGAQIGVSADGVSVGVQAKGKTGIAATALDGGTAVSAGGLLDQNGIERNFVGVEGSGQLVGVSAQASGPDPNGPNANQVGVGLLATAVESGGTFGVPLQLGPSLARNDPRDAPAIPGRLGMLFVGQTGRLFFNGPNGWQEVALVP
jgi:hypothetical protein